MTETGVQALYMLLYGNPVPYKYFGGMKLYDINDALAPLQLSALECKYKQTRSFYLKNDGPSIDSVHCKAFKIVRAVLYIQQSMYREDLIQLLEDNVRVGDDFSWDEFAYFCQYRYLLDVYEVSATLYKVQISPLGQQMMPDEAVEKFLCELGLEYPK